MGIGFGGSVGIVLGQITLIVSTTGYGTLISTGFSTSRVRVQARQLDIHKIAAHRRAGLRELLIELEVLTSRVAERDLERSRLFLCDLEARRRGLDASGGIVLFRACGVACELGKARALGGLVRLLERVARLASSSERKRPSARGDPERDSGGGELGDQWPLEL